MFMFWIKIIALNNKIDNYLILQVIQNNDENADCRGLRITKLNKIFHKYPFGIKSSGDVHAFKDIYLEVDDCELLALIGHNGAGNLN